MEKYLIKRKRETNDSTPSSKKQKLSKEVEEQIEKNRKAALERLKKTKQQKSSKFSNFETKLHSSWSPLFSEFKKEYFNKIKETLIQQVVFDNYINS